MSRVARRVRAWIETTNRTPGRRPARESPAACGRGLKRSRDGLKCFRPGSPAACGRGLKQVVERIDQHPWKSPAACGRGLKRQSGRAFVARILVARRVRAWIETNLAAARDPRSGSRPPRAGVD